MHETASPPTVIDQCQSRPEPTVAGTIALLAAIGLAFISLEEDLVSASTAAQEVAVIVGIGLGISLLLDLHNNLRNLVRTDVVCLLSLYGLTLVERLTTDPEFDKLNSLVATQSGLALILIAFAGLALGRHIAFSSRNRFIPSAKIEVPMSWLFGIILAAFVVSILHMLLATSFDLVKIYDGLVGPRFARPWARGRLGGWNSLLNELALLFYLIPPLSAIIATRWREYSAIQLLTVASICFFTFFEAFAGGTRNIFLTHLISFCAAFVLLSERLTWRRLSAVGLVFLAIATFATHQMLEFRRMGLRNYLTNEVYSRGETRERLFVDDNLSSISQLSSVFPEQYPYLGWEIPFWALVKPIPRALWPGKPEGLSISIEYALSGDEAYTIATTYIGEAYMAFGKTGVVFTSLLFGCLASHWNRFAGSKSGSLGVVIFSSGFFAAAITMRSLVWLTTAMLPTIALLIFWHCYLKPRMTDTTINGPATLPAN